MTTEPARILILAGKMDIMPKAHPEEFSSDVVALARKREIPWTQIAKDFGIWRSVGAQLGEEGGRRGRVGGRAGRHRVR